MRLGFFIGFLIGAGIASVLLKTERAEAPGEGVEAPRTVAAESQSALARIKRQFQAARQASREAAAEREDELLREWERARQRRA